MSGLLLKSGTTIFSCNRESFPVRIADCMGMLFCASQQILCELCLQNNICSDFLNGVVKGIGGGIGQEPNAFLSQQRSRGSQQVGMPGEME